jgi:hemoglobin/transferrin/lactoferrin receptor protein
MAGTTKRAIALLSGTTALVASAVVSPASAQVTLLDAITIIATKTQELAIDTLAPVSTIREEQLRQNPPQRVHDIFTGVPGVTTSASGQEASTSINIRGLQDFGRVNVTIDGARQNYARIGHQSGAGSFFLEPELIGGVDIVRGPTSNIYGSGAIGGVVSFRTKDVEDIISPGQSWGIQTNATGGTNGFNGVGSLFMASRISPNAEFIFGGSVRDQDDYKSGNGTRIPNSGQEVQTFLAKGTFRPAEGHQIKTGLIIYNADWANGTPPLQAFPASTVIRDFNSVNTTATFNHKYKPSDNQFWDTDSTVYWNRVDATSLIRNYNVVPTLMQRQIFGDVGARANYLIDTVGFDVNNTSRFTTGGFEHAFTYGADMFRDDVQNRAFAPGPGLLPGFGAGYNPRGERQVSGGFAQLKSNYSIFQLITALRYDNYQLEGINLAPGATTPNVSNGGERLSPKFTIGVTPVQSTTLYASYAEGYRAPAVTETLISAQHPGGPGANFPFIPNPNLRPEVGKNTEIGMNIKQDNWLSGGDKLRIKTAVFQNNVDDYIDTVNLTRLGFPGGSPLCPAGLFPGPAYFFCVQYQNVEQARISGFEFEGMYDRGSWFLGFAGHLIRGENVQTGAGLNSVHPPMASVTFGNRWLDGKLQAAIRWAAVSAKKAHHTSGTNVQQFTAAVGSYNLVSLYVGYEINPTLQLGFSVENLLNEQYKIYTHEFPNAGLTAKLSIRKTFGSNAPDLSAVNALNTANLRPQQAPR